MALEALNPQPKYGRGLPLGGFPLVDHGLAGRADFCGQLPLTETEPVAQAHQCRGIVRWHGHSANGQETTSTTSIRSAIPSRHELCGSVSSGRRGELSKKRSWPERRSEPAIMRGSAERPHVNLEFVGEYLKRHAIMRGPLRRERPRMPDERVWRAPSARIPCAERLDRNAKRCRAFSLGQAKSCPDFPQDRDALSHRRDDAMDPPRLKAMGER
jgi:hypothetical protein